MTEATKTAMNIEMKNPLLPKCAGGNKLPRKASKGEIDHETKVSVKARRTIRIGSK
jgi:hypothetical protein